jgi:hypothetical protein
MFSDKTSVRTVKNALWIYIPNDVQWYVNHLLEAEGITQPVNCETTLQDMAVVLKRVGCSVFIRLLISTTFVLFRLKWSNIFNDAWVAVTVCSRFLTMLDSTWYFWVSGSLHCISYRTGHISINLSLPFLMRKGGDKTFYTNANTSRWTSLVQAVFSLLQ